MSWKQMPLTPDPEIPDPEVQDPEVQDPEVAEPRNRRKWPRYALAERENFTITAGDRIGTCTIEDISLGGARLRMDGSAPDGPDIRIEHPRLGQAFGRCCWKAQDRLGVAFDHTGPSLAFIAGCVAEVVESASANPAV